MKKFICVLLCFLCIPLAFADEPPPFSPVVGVNMLYLPVMLYLSGQLGTVKPGQPPLVGGGIVPETTQAMENIKKVLEEKGFSMNNIVKCTVMLADIKELPLMNKVYASYFPNGHFPARSAFGVAGLAFNARVEIECLAAVN